MFFGHPRHWQRHSLVAVAFFSFLWLGTAAGVTPAFSATPRPDYFVSATVDPYFATGPITIIYVVTNQSDANAPATVVKFSVARDGSSQKQTIGQVPVAALGPWQSRQETVTLRLPSSLPTGLTWMRLYSQINPQLRPGESNTSNNITSVGFGAQLGSPSPSPSPGLPDLTVSQVSCSGVVQSGGSITISDTIQNIGSAAAGSFSIAYILKASSVVLTLTSRLVTGLQAGSISLGAFSVPLPVTLAPGFYTLVVQTNADGAVHESNTQNNQATAPFSVTAAPPPPLPGPTGTFLSDADVHPVPSVPRPPLRVPVVDPTFGATVTRLTDPSQAPADSSGPTLGLRHEYARYPALNADNSKVVVTVLGGADRGYYEVRDVKSGNLLYKVAPSGDPEISWHPSDPTRFFYRSGNEIRIFHVDTGQIETLMAFPQYYYISTRDEGRPSDDWRYYAFVGYHDSSFSSADLVVVDLSTKQVVTTWKNAGIPDWVSMSPSGAAVIAQWTTGEGTRLYNRENFAYVRTILSDYAHSDFAYDTEGNEVLVYQPSSAKQIIELDNPSGAPLAMSRLLDGKKTILLPIGWEWFTPHFSGLASRAHPGWVLVSTYTDAQNPQQPFAREIFWLKLDGSKTVRRLAHHHSDQGFRPAPWGGLEKDYFAEPQATSSWDGNIVLFNSVWGEPFNHYDLYAVTGQWW